MLNAKQIRAARALLDWTQEALAERSHVARATIKNVESGLTLPRLETANALQRSLEEAGVEFLPGSGVRMRDQLITTYEGTDANKNLVEDIYVSLRDTGGDLYIAHTNEQEAIDDIGFDYLKEHIAKRRQANIRQHLFIRASDAGLIPPLDTYRIMPDEYFAASTLCVYGSKMALTSWKEPKKTIIINDERFADAARRLLKFAWDRTEMPSYKAVSQAG